MCYLVSCNVVVWWLCKKKLSRIQVVSELIIMDCFSHGHVPVKSYFIINCPRDRDQTDRQTYPMFESRPLPVWQMCSLARPGRPWCVHCLESSLADWEPRHSAGLTDVLRTVVFCNIEQLLGQHRSDRHLGHVSDSWQPPPPVLIARNEWCVRGGGQGQQSRRGKPGKPRQHLLPQLCSLHTQVHARVLPQPPSPPPGSRQLGPQDREGLGPGVSAGRHPNPSPSLPEVMQFRRGGRRWPPGTRPPLRSPPFHRPAVSAVWREPTAGRSRAPSHPPDQSPGHQDPRVRQSGSP